MPAEACEEPRRELGVVEHGAVVVAIGGWVVASRRAEIDARIKTLTEQRDGLRSRMTDAERRLTGPLSQAWDGAAPADRSSALTALKEALATRAYLRTVIDDLSAALGEGSEETHVANRRD